MQTLSEKDEKYVKGWSWGAFFGSWIFLFVHKQNKLAWKVLILFIVMQLFSFIPIFAAEANGFGKILGLIYFGVGIWLGVRGREIVWKSGVYSLVEEFKKKAPLVAKLTIIFVVINFSIFIYSMVSSFGKYVAHPELIDQQIMEQALLKAKSDNPSLNDTEFKQGYSKGMIDGNADGAVSFTADKTNSYQEGYKFGYTVACMQLHNDEMLCLKKLLGK